METKTMNELVEISSTLSVKATELLWEAHRTGINRMLGSEELAVFQEELVAEKLASLCAETGAKTLTDLGVEVAELL